MNAIRKTALLLPLSLLWMAASPTATADAIYRHQAADGSVVFSDRSAAGEEAEIQPQPRIGNSYTPAPPATDRPAATINSSADSANRSRGIAGAPNAYRAGNNASGQASDTAPQRDCQATYGLSCAEVDHWQEHARQHCLRSGSDRCDDPVYLERRFKPRPLAELREVARRAALRGTRDEAMALHELQRLFTDYCAVRIALYCEKATDSKACEKKFTDNCRDDRDVDAVLAKYSELSPSEQARIQQVIKEFGTTRESELTRMFKDVLRQVIGLAL